MPTLKSLILSLALVLGAVLPAQAVTLARFSISDGEWVLNDGNRLTITADFAANISGLLFPDPDAFRTNPILFSAAVRIAGGAFHQQRLGPMTADFTPGTVVPMVLSRFGLGAGTGLTWDTAFAYMAGGLGRQVGGRTLGFGQGELFFTYTVAASGPGTMQGRFTAAVTRASRGVTDPTLADLINDGLFDLTLLGVLPGRTVLPDDGGDFDTDILVSSVPLPAGMVLLMGGLMGLSLIRRYSC